MIPRKYNLIRTSHTLRYIQNNVGYLVGIKYKLIEIGNFIIFVSEFKTIGIRLINALVNIKGVVIRC